MLARVAEHGDLFEPVLTLEQQLPGVTPIRTVTRAPAHHGAVRWEAPAERGAARRSPWRRSLAACSAEHSAPQVASPFAPPDDDAARRGGRRPRRAVAGGQRRRARGGRSSRRLDGDRTRRRRRPPHRARRPARDPWAVFDEALAARLIGSGDYAVGVAVAVDGEIVHTADFGYRVPAAAPPPPRAVDPRPSTPSSATVQRVHADVGRRRRRRAGRRTGRRADRARRPLPHRQHQQGDHGDRRAAARRGRSARARRPRRRSAWPTLVGATVADPQVAGDHRAPAAVAHGRACRRTRARSSAAASTRARPPAQYGLSRGLSAAARDGVHVLEPQLLPARPARRADRRTALRGRRHRPPARPARHRGHAHGDARTTPTRRRSCTRRRRRATTWRRSAPPARGSPRRPTW